jgi:hypothetical protein
LISAGEILHAFWPLMIRRHRWMFNEVGGIQHKGQRYRLITIVNYSAASVHIRECFTSDKCRERISVQYSTSLTPSQKHAQNFHQIPQKRLKAPQSASFF